MLLAMVDDIRVILVKLADRLHNMRTLEFMPEEKRPRVAQETLDIYAPIASRLGMSKMKNELEELAFMHLEPQAYQSLRSRVDAKRAATEGVIDELTAAIRTKLAAAEVPVVAVDGRVKRLYSIWLKLRRQKIDLDQVYDFVAIRIVTPSVKDCYAALGIIHQAWSPVPGRIKDFIAMPRPNGYQSLHTSVVSDRGVPFEVQIRTEEMHHHAEDGIAAHWKYKEGRVGAARDEQYFQWMRQLLETQQDVRDSQEFLNHLKIDLYREEVYTFTPAGQVKVLPDGATPIDFAYAVHTDVGHRCVGARVNGRMVPLRTRLKNGDIVEIMTAAGHSPSRDWLGVVKTSRARSKIRQFIQTEENVRAIDVGRKLLEKEAKRFDIPKASLEEGALATAVAALGLGKVDDLLAQVGYGKVAARQVLDALVPEGQLKERAPDHPVVSAVKRVLRPGAAAADRITVSGADDLMVMRARCCNPIRGEKIVGYVTRGKGVSVHAAACPNVVNLMYDPQRRIDVEWDKGGDPAPYTVRLTMQVEDRKGMLAALSASIADINTNILTLEATTGGEQRPHRRHRRDQGHEAPREGDQVTAQRRRRARYRARDEAVGRPPDDVSRGRRWRRSPPARRGGAGRPAPSRGSGTAGRSSWRRRRSRSRSRPCRPGKPSSWPPWRSRHRPPSAARACSRAPARSARGCRPPRWCRRCGVGICPDRNTS